MTRCTPSCRTPSPAQAHCGVCHITFGGITGFDSHRRNGQCRPVTELGMIDRDGVWRIPMDDAMRERLVKLKATDEEPPDVP